MRENAILLYISQKELLQYFNFTVIVLGVFALIDFLGRFKRPYHFKICFSILLFSMIFLEILLWRQYSFFEIVRLSPFINTGLWASGLFTLSILTTGKIEKWIWVMSGVILLLNLYNYFSLANIHYDSVTNPNQIFSLRFTKGYALINLVRYLQRIILLVSIIRLYRVIRKNRVEGSLYQQKLIRWVGLLVGLVMISVLLNNIISIFSYQSPNFANFQFILFNLFCLSIFILTVYRPVFLNHQDISKLDFSKYIQSQPLKLTDLNFYLPFFTNTYYLQKEAGIDHFCKQNGIEESDSFNEQIIKTYNMSFANLVNKKRVEYFMEIARNPSFRNFTIEALALESGFNSRTALYKPFKKFHGGTPVDYINSINN